MSADGGDANEGKTAGVGREMIVTPAFGRVADKAMELIEQAHGGALCVYRGGEPVIDVWAGPRDPSSGSPWQRDTMGMGWSTTKGIASTALHMLADRGELDLAKPVATYWPEFAAEGKDRVTVEQVLAMEAGLYDIRHLIVDPHTMLDHDAMASALAGARPRHEPGTACAYHALTYGWLVGELVRRITGNTLGAFVQTEIAEPLGLDGCYIGTPSDQLARVAARPKLPPENAVVRRLAKIADPIFSLGGLSPERIASAFAPRGGYDVIPTDEFLEAEVPSANGVFTARSLARIYASLGRDDGLDGVRLWSPETRRRATQRRKRGRDLVLAFPIRWQLGYHPPFPRRSVSRSAFGFYGAYGSGAYADPERGLAVGLVVRDAQRLPLPKLVKLLGRA